MTNRTTKSALLMSALALLLCIAMLTGTTFAWFTDEVKSGKNTITAGNLDVELRYAKVVDGQITAFDTVASKTDIFDPNALWEPGHVEVVYLEVSNLGSLALKYQLGVNVYNETPGTNVKGETFKLSDHLVFKVVNIADTAEAFKPYATREAAIEAAGTVKGLKDYNGKTTALEAKTGVDYVALIVYMPETVGNEANYKTGTTAPSIELGINLFATQVESEFDSFGDDYDDDAWNKGFKVLSADDLRDAIANGEKNIVLMDDIDLTESIVIPAASATFAMRSAPAPVVLNLNGKTISNPNGYVIENYGNVVIDGNGTLTGLGVIRSHAGNITIENGNFYASSRWQDGVYQHSLKAENTNVVINGGNFDATVNGQTNAVLNASENAVITINGGSFKNVAGALTQFDPYLFTYEKNGKVVINDGTFYGGWRFNGVTTTTDIYGGTFTVGFDGQSFHANSTHVVTVYGGTFTAGTKLANKLDGIVATGYKAVENNGIFTVLFPQESFNNLINNAQPGETVNVPAGNFTMTSKNDLVLVGSGEDTVITFTNSIENVNISNATIAGEPRLAVKQGQSAVFNNVAFEGTKAWGSVQGTAEFVGCSFEGLLHIDSSAATTTIKFTDCIFGAYSVIKLGGSADYVLENCTVEKLAADATGAWGKEWLITYCDTTFTDCTLGRQIRAGKTITITLNNCVDAADKAVTPAIVHANASPVVVIDGATCVATADALAAAVANGVTNIMLADGEYDVANCGGKTLTITGSKNAVLKVMNEGEDGADYGFDTSNVTFKGITVDTTANTGSYKGYARLNATFIDCAFIGGGFTTFEATNFDKCTFNLAGYIWTWGATEVNFDACTFIGDSRTILAHGSANTVINIKDCDFAATTKGHTGGGDWTAVVEIDPTGSNVYTINFEGENTLSVNYPGWTRIKDGSTGHIVNGLN